MLELCKLMWCALVGLFRSRASLEAEILLLRHQLNVLRRKSPKRPTFSNLDRLIFAGLYGMRPNVLSAMAIVKPESVIRWHRNGFRLYWRWKSKSLGGRPKVAADIRKLIRDISLANPLWGAPRIHGELLKVGIEVGQTTVAKYMARNRRPPSQGWKTFLRNHADGIASMDLFVVPTISFRLLYGLLILKHCRREILHLAATAHPSAEWISRQLTEAYGWEEGPYYLVRDRDSVYGEVFTRRLRAMGIRDRPTAPRSPWQNAYCERLIGSIRRECLDHVVIFGESHLRHLLRSYQKYYNECRTHLSLAKDAPLSRAVQVRGYIAVSPVLGGLHHPILSRLSFRQGQVPTLSFRFLYAASNGGNLRDAIAPRAGSRGLVGAALECRPQSGRRWPPSSCHILAHAGLTNVDAELDQFALYARCAPQ
jgi:transposase InsO family protein